MHLFKLIILMSPQICLTKTVILTCYPWICCTSLSTSRNQMQNQLGIFKHNNNNNKRQVLRCISNQKCSLFLTCPQVSHLQQWVSYEAVHMGAGKVCLLIRYHTLQCNVLIYITIYLILNGRCEMGHTAYSTAFIIRNSNLKQENWSDG